MYKSVEGVLRNGRVEFDEPVSKIKDGTRLIVTFLEPAYLDLEERGISREQAARRRAQLSSFAEEWESPEMNAYDDYDSAKRKL